MRIAKSRIVWVPIATKDGKRGYFVRGELHPCGLAITPKLDPYGETDYGRDCHVTHVATGLRLTYTPFDSKVQARRFIDVMARSARWDMDGDELREAVIEQAKRSGFRRVGLYINHVLAACRDRSTAGLPETMGDMI